MSCSIEDLLKSHFSIQEEKADHHFRTELPNIIFDLDLDVYEFKLYATLKKIAGDCGGCWKSLINLSKDSGISESKIKTSLKKLSSSFPLLDNQPLITLIERKKDDGSPDTHLVIINNIWRISGDQQREKHMKGGGSPENPGVGRGKTQGGSQKTYKEDLSNKIPKEEDVCMPASPAEVVVMDFKGNIQKYTKADLFFIAEKQKLNWTTDEITYLYKVLAKNKSNIVSLTKFCQTVVDKKRMVDRTDKYANLSKKQEKPKPSHESIPVQPKQNLKRWGDILTDINKKG